MTESVTDKMKSSSLDGVVVKDSLERNITLRRPNILDEYYLAKALGEDATNPTCFEMMLATIFVAKIDDQVFQTPRTYQECIASLSKLKSEGALAVQKGLSTHHTNAGGVEEIKK